MAGGAAAASSTAACTASLAPNPTARDPVRRRRVVPRPPPLVAAAASRRHGSNASPLLSSLPRDPFLNPRLRFAAAAAAEGEMAAEASAAAAEGAQAKPFSVLFVCLGNICRSPAAEAVFRNLVSKRGLESKFLIDSAGTIGYHEVVFCNIMLVFTFAVFSDGIIIDKVLLGFRQCAEDLLSSFERWRHREPLPDSGPKKVKLMCSYCKRHTESEVPDPYYGGPQGFEKVLDLLEDACESLLDSIVAENAGVSA
uniref:acid phosphatase n=1 Tax=Oryza meridionalis TaxID=40149 RepID=A0A0E0ENZ0_9ORYZ